MTPKTRRNRREGSIGTLKRYLWSVVCYNLEVVEDTRRPHVLRQKAGNALVQAGMAWLKATEQGDLLKRIEELEAADRERQSTRNGYHA